mgnify:CR=1 FL=1
MSTSERWPAIPVADWQDTRDTLQLYTQVIGKVRLANEPLVNHWWSSALYVTARGLTTSLMPHPTGPAFQVDFDFLAHRLDITTVDGAARALALEDRTVADFHDAVMALLDDLGVGTAIWPVPVEIPGAIPFRDDDGLPGVLPAYMLVVVITALLGGPVFLLLLIKAERRYQ